MNYPDLNTIIAASMHGAIIGMLAASAPSKPDEDGNKPDPTKVPECWNKAPEEFKADALKATRFLASYCSSSRDPAQIDRESACMALATTMKGSAMADLKPNYRVLVEIFISTRQSIL